MPEGLYILDHHRKPIRDAAVSIDGKLLSFDKVLDKYSLPENAAIPGRLKVEKPGFEPLEYPVFRYLTDRVYLLKNNDASFWQNGIKVACLPYSGQLLVWMNELDPKNAKEQLESKGKSWNLEIVKTFPGEHPKGGGIARAPAFLAKPNAPENAKDLVGSLRASKNVAFAGPMLTHDSSSEDVLGLASALHFYFMPEVASEDALSFLKKHDLVAEPNPAFDRDRFLRVVLPPDTMLEAVNRIENLQNLKEVLYIDNEIVTLNTF